ncbi:MAG: hypothetical protein M3297_12275 [Thermoproteota archaeon]|nr:hypothetical protein [Thermoproteota archaeon]
MFSDMFTSRISTQLLRNEAPTGGPFREAGLSEQEEQFPPTHLNPSSDCRLPRTMTPKS